jgi:hypothetical protein
VGDGLLDLGPWREQWNPRAWRDYLGSGDTAQKDDLIRRCTHTGRPPSQKADTRRTSLAF